MSKHHDHHKLRGAKYERFRGTMLQRDKFRCECCGKAGRLELHHIERLEDGGDPWDPANVKILTRDCHIKLTTRENRERNPIPPDVQAWHDFIEAAFPKA